jgi:hypothetical protein
MGFGAPSAAHKQAAGAEAKIAASAINCRCFFIFWQKKMMVRYFMS